MSDKLIYFFVVLLSGFACSFCHFFFFKQKTAYDMRISDWSSDVCSSDLLARLARLGLAAECDIIVIGDRFGADEALLEVAVDFARRLGGGRALEIGRASCRERVCQYV